MNEERVLSLDISTKTGWAFMLSSKDYLVLEAYGTMPAVHMPEGDYPASFIEWANTCFSKILELIDRYAPEVLIIEETSAGSKAIYTQKILEYIHFLMADFIKKTGIKAYYFMTEQWRRETGCQMTKEESKRNKAVRDYKKKNKTSIAYDKDGKRTGLINRKHVNIRRANEIFKDYLTVPLRKKDEDKADAALLGFAYHLRRLKLEGLSYE